LVGSAADQRTRALARAGIIGAELIRRGIDDPLRVVVVGAFVIGVTAERREKPDKQHTVS
jgi:hypothetical protein